MDMIIGPKTSNQYMTTYYPTLPCTTVQSKICCTLANLAYDFWGASLVSSTHNHTEMFPTAVLHIKSDKAGK